MTAPRDAATPLAGGVLKEAAWEVQTDRRAGVRRV